MSNDLGNAAKAFLQSPAGEKLGGKRDEFTRLLATPDAQKVQKMMSGKTESLKSAFKNGDMETVTSALDELLKTEEGARLVENLRNMMK